MSYSKYEIILVRYPFSDLSSSKVRPAIIINSPHPSQDYFIVPLSSRTQNLLSGEFVLKDWQNVGLNVVSSVKRGIFTIQESLIIKKIGSLTHDDIKTLEESLKEWLGL
ncbi:type II toxin-antitoxin system PemK/MazF family toxin [Cyanobacterium aponinum UTEX 3222]|uniref:type II toxin-antitoxin system PemK/MazF family toxin n=1 Tax=Cyanobacterium aponinum TaxID=379064 RepID=UPI002B4BD0ED|nr:type II toxin-antitoxin system PemK/MazF family toxin [Cyanobacterium aponinum]WRL37555.1 type II toxin-antitoxin system PemK/MazF family toxin [Cyanobacterium aponinum UTEX 3221]WRL41123.1 type II toxin-antitoxin system PemK/MazF family toxin [Cyanobacterium aponinum UTEX 3222]